MEMEKRYYIADRCPENDELVEDTLAKRNECHAARRKLAADFGSDSVMIRNTKVVGPAYMEKKNLPWLKWEERMQGGYGYYPKKSTKLGKAYEKRLNEEEILHFDPSKYILDKLKLHRCVFGGRGLYFAVAGIADERIIVSIPGPLEADRGEDPFPVVPEWLKEVKMSEWYAIQGE